MIYWNVDTGMGDVLIDSDEYPQLKTIKTGLAKRKDGKKYKEAVFLLKQIELEQARLASRVYCCGYLAKALGAFDGDDMNEQY